MPLEGAGLQLFGIFELFGHPNTTIVAERLAHKSQFRLVIAMLGNAGGVDLCHTRIGKVCALFVALPSCGAVRGHRIGGEEVGIAISSGGYYHGMSSIALNGTRGEIASNDPSCTTFDNNEVKHFVTSIELNAPLSYLATECRVSPE